MWRCGEKGNWMHCSQLERQRLVHSPIAAHNKRVLLLEKFLLCLRSLSIDDRTIPSSVVVTELTWNRCRRRLSRYAAPDVRTLYQPYI
jgi:hypothetical protein